MAGLPPRVVTSLLLALACLAAAVLTWPLGGVQPLAGVDASWGAALHLAARDGLHHGDEVLFTFGPLGFLDVPKLWGTGTGVAAIAFTLLQQALLVAVVGLSLRPAVGLVAGVVVGVAVAALGLSSALPAVGLVLAVRLLGDAPRGRRALVVTTALALLGALEAAIKLNSGVLVLAVGLVAAAAHPERRRLVPVFAGAAVLGYVVIWLATGQALGELPGYLSGASQIVSGYSEAMGTDDPALRWQYGVVALLALLGAAVLLRTAPRDRTVRGGLLLMWAIFAFLAFKAGFVRHDAGHAQVTLGLLAVALCASPWRPGQRWSAVAVVAVSLIAVLLGWRGTELGLGDRPANGVAAVRAVVDPSARERIRRGGVLGVLLGTGVDRRLLDRARAFASVAVWPTESSLNWAAELPFRPLPVLQDYQSYTSDLDRRDAEALADDATAPAAVLLSDRPLDQVDGRPTALNGPQTARALLCRYRAIDASPGWSLLRRGADRCTTRPRALGSVRARTGQAVPVPAPAPDAFVAVRIEGAEVSGTERLRSLLLRAQTREMSLDGRAARLTPGTSADGAPLRAGRAVDFPTPLASGARTVSVAIGGGERRALTYRFFEQRLTGGG